MPTQQLKHKILSLEFLFVLHTKPMKTQMHSLIYDYDWFHIVLFLL